MSFGGGGREQYTLEYIVKVVNQGGGGALNQINQGFTKTSTTATQATVSTEKLAAASNRLSQAQAGVTKATKSVAFGFFGITTAGAEMFGMLSMLQQVQLAQKEATEEQAQALKESGKESKAYKDATAEVVKVNRWASMTTRNFMLSIFDMIPFTIMAVHGLTKMVTAAKELKAAKAAADNLRLLGFNASGVAAQMLRAGTSIGGFTPQLSKFSNATTIATTGTFKFGQETVKTTKFFGAGEAALISNAIAMGKSEKAATGAAKAMRVLGIAMKVAIPLIALEVGAQAFANNWGGFRDKINAVGVAIGDTIPALKGMLGWIDKIGRSIVAIFTGDFKSIGAIWDTDKMEKGVQLTDNQKKAQEALAQSIKESAQAGSELVTEFVEMDKKARKTFLFEHGIKGGAKKRVTEALEGLDELKQHFVNFGEDLKLIKLDEQLGKWFDLPKSFYKKVGFTMSHRFTEMGKEIKDKGLINLGKELEKAAKEGKGFEGFKQAVINAVKFDPTLMAKLEVFEPETYKQFKVIMDEEAAKLKAIADKSISNAFVTGDIINPNKGEGITTFDKNGKAINTPKQEVDMLKKGLAIGKAFALGIIEGVKTADWSSISGIIFEKVVVPASLGIALFASEVKNLIVANLPTDWSEVQTRIDDGITGAMNTSVTPMGGMQNNDKWKKFVDERISNPLLKAIGDIQTSATWPKIQERINNLMSSIFGGSTDVAGQFNEAETRTFPERNGEVPKGFLEKIQSFIAPLFDIKNWQTAISNLANPQFWADVTTSITDAVTGALDRLQAANKADESRFDKTAPGSGGMGPSKWIQDTLAPYFKPETWQSWIDSFVKGLTGVFDGINQTVHAEIDAALSDNQIELNPLNPDDVSNDVMSKLDTRNARGKKKFDPKNRTFELIIPSATGIIENIIPDISKAKITNVLNPGGGGPGDIPTSPPPTHGPTDPFNKRGLNQLLISVPSATVVPQTVTLAIDWATLITDAATNMQIILTGWINTMTDMSGLANVTVQAVAKVFGGMVINISAGITGLGETWSAISNSFGANAESGANQSESALLDAMSSIESKMTDLAKHWSKMCNSMIKNAKSAASGITKAMNSIPDTESVHTIRVRRVYEFAEGGEMTDVISAAGGKILTTHGEQMFKIGDNPGGQESIWAIPHNRPGPIVEQINSMYGSSNGIERSGVISSQPIEIHTHNHYLERDVETIKRIENNRLVSRFGG